MKYQEQSLFSPEQFIELENACDLFERRLREGNPLDIKTLVEQTSSEIKKILNFELGNLLEEFNSTRCDETISPQEQTMTPAPAATLIQRVAKFDASHQAVDTDKLKESANQKSDTVQGRFGRFQLHSIVGRGGSGVVWRAFDGNLNRWVALKIAHPRSGMDSKRFVREAQAVARLKHPCIIPVFDAGELDGKCYLVSEFCNGQTLSQVIKNRILKPREAVAIVLSVVDAVNHSHRAGIVHRDIKPHNIMITTDGIPMVTDFGLARNLLQDQTLTLEGELIGTPGYMAPEQATGGAHQCDERTDIYSIGVVLFQLLSGQVPFSGSFERVVFQVVNSPPPNLLSIDHRIPRELAAICAKCLEKTPDRRFQSADELGEELRRFSEGQPVETRAVTMVGRYFRWLQREPGIAWATSVSAMLLLLAVVGTTVAAWSLNHAWRSERAQVIETKKSLADAIDARLLESKARARAETAEDVAEKNAQLARQLAKASQQEVDFLSNLLAPVDLMGLNQMYPIDDGAPQLLSEKTILNAERQVDLLLADAPIVRARIKGMLANAWRSRGKLGEARALLEDATQLLEGNPELDESQLKSDLAMNQLYWAYLCHHCEEFQRAEKFYQQSILLHEQLANDEEHDAIDSLQLAQAEFGLGALYLRQRRNRDAEPFLKRALRKRRKFLAHDDSLLMASELVYAQCMPESDEVDLSTVLQAIGQDGIKKGMGLYWEIGALRKVCDYSSAADRYDELIELIQIHVGEDSSLYAMALGDYASLQWDAGNFVEAQGMADQAIKVSAQLYPWHSRRMSAMLRTASEKKLAHRFAEAKELLLEVAQHESPKWNQSVQLHLDLAWCNFHLGQFEQAIEHSEKPLTKIGSNTAAETAWISHTHATMLEAAGRTKDAEGYHKLAIETAVKMLGDGSLPNHSTWLKRTALVLMHHQRVPEAEPVFRLAIEVAERVYFSEHPRVADLKVLLADNLIAQELPDQAKPLIEQALKIQESCLPESDLRIVFSRELLEKISN